MTTASETVQIAAGQIGTKENPAGSNRVKYWDWYKLAAGVDYNGSPWCACFVSWVMQKAGEWNVKSNESRYIYCPALVSWAKSVGQWVDREQVCKAGDIILFANKGVACHVGIVEKRISSSQVQTIEGNTSVSNNDNGGNVMRRTRTYGSVGSSWYILGFVRPAYKPASIPNPKKIAKQQPGKSMNNNQLWYRAHCQTIGLQEAVHDGQIAGTVGFSKRLEGLWIDTRQLKKKFPDIKLDVTAHLQGKGDVKYKDVKHDTLIGSKGESRRMESIIIDAEGLPEGTHLKYRVHSAKLGWSDWVTEGNLAGTMGDSLGIQAIQIYVS